MATSRGKAEVKRFMASIPADLEKKVLRGAARAGGAVVMEEIKAETPSAEVREGVRMRTKRGDGEIVVTIDVKPGWARSLGTWLEYGTAPHFIRVDESQRQGMSIGRINEAHKAGSLVINGKFVGGTVLHPGARAHPAFRPALDRKEVEAVAAAQKYINSHVSPSGIVAGPDADGEGE